MGSSDQFWSLTFLPGPVPVLKVSRFSRDGCLLQWLSYASLRMTSVPVNWSHPALRIWNCHECNLMETRLAAERALRRRRWKLFDRSWKCASRWFPHVYMADFGFRSYQCLQPPFKVFFCGHQAVSVNKNVFFVVCPTKWRIFFFFKKGRKSCEIPQVQKWLFDNSTSRRSKRKNIECREECIYSHLAILMFYYWIICGLYRFIKD